MEAPERRAVPHIALSGRPPHNRNGARFAPVPTARQAVLADLPQELTEALRPIP
jgi:hypothetical protein